MWVSLFPLPENELLNRTSSPQQHSEPQIKRCVILGQHGDNRMNMDLSPRGGRCWNMGPILQIASDITEAVSYDREESGLPGGIDAYMGKISCRGCVVIPGRARSCTAVLEEHIIPAVGNGAPAANTTLQASELADEYVGFAVFEPHRA